MSTERNKEQAGALKQYEYTDAVETAKAYFLSLIHISEPTRP